MAIEVKSNPPRWRTANGKHGGWLPDRPDHVNDHGIADRVGAPPRGARTGFLMLKRPQDFPRVRDQGAQGSCGGFSARACLRYSFAGKHGDKIAGKWGERWDLSPAGIYMRTRERQKTLREDSGVEIRLVWDAMREHGAPTEEAAPYQPRILMTRLTARAVQSGKWHQATPRTFRCDDKRDGGNREMIIERMAQAIEQDMPLNYGFSTFSNLTQADGSGIVPLPKGRLDGGHAITGFAMDFDNRLVWGPNSWGTRWGGPAPAGARHQERGWIGMPFQFFIDGHADDVWAVDIE